MLRLDKRDVQKLCMHQAATGDSLAKGFVWLVGRRPGEEELEHIKKLVAFLDEQYTREISRTKNRTGP